MATTGRISIDNKNISGFHWRIEKFLYLCSNLLANVSLSIFILLNSVFCIFKNEYQGMYTSVCIRKL